MFDFSDKIQIKMFLKLKGNDMSKQIKCISNMLNK